MTKQETDWDEYGACTSCGAVPQKPCYRLRKPFKEIVRQYLKNPHAGRPRYRPVTPGTW